MLPLQTHSFVWARKSTQMQRQAWVHEPIKWPSDLPMQVKKQIHFNNSFCSLYFPIAPLLLHLAGRVNWAIWYLEWGACDYLTFLPLDSTASYWLPFLISTGTIVHFSSFFFASTIEILLFFIKGNGGKDGQGFDNSGSRAFPTSTNGTRKCGWCVGLASYYFCFFNLFEHIIPLLFDG